MISIVKMTNSSHTAFLTEANGERHPNTCSTEHSLDELLAASLIRSWPQKMKIKQQ
jgi:hypothetical protein